MSLEALNPPVAPRLSASRAAARREHLLEEIRLDGGRSSRLRRWFTRQSRPRRLALVIVLVLLLGGVGTAVGVSVDLLAKDVAFHKQFDRGQLTPRPTSSFVYVTRGSDWALIAWKSTRGICLDYAYEDTKAPDGFNGFGGCGMPVVGSPPDLAHKQPPNTDVVGYLSGSQGLTGPWVISGPVSPGVAKVKIELTTGEAIDASIYSAPSALDTQLRFYLLRQNRPITVSALAAYDSAGKLLQRKVVATPPKYVPKTAAVGRVPFVAGLPESVAIRTIRAAGGVPVRVRRVSDSAPVGIVTAQSPPAGSPLVKGTLVTINVSKGK